MGPDLKAMRLKARAAAHNVPPSETSSSRRVYFISADTLVRIYEYQEAMLLPSEASAVRALLGQALDTFESRNGKQDAD